MSFGQYRGPIGLGVCDRCGQSLAGGCFRHADPVDCIAYLRKRQKELNAIKPSETEIATALSTLSAERAIAIKLYARARGIGIDEATDNVIDAVANKQGQHDLCADAGCPRCGRGDDG